MNKAKTLALFDIDGTLTTRDTMFVFVQHALGPVRLLFGLVWLSPMLVAMKLGLVANDRAKVLFLKHFFGGRSRDELMAWGTSFITEIEGLLRPTGRQRLQQHRDQGDTVLLVSASLDLWMQPWAESLGLTLLCTRGAFDDSSRFTGDLETPNCHGPEKVVRVRATLDPDAFDRIVAYGDSSGDTEMLELAHEGHFKPFR